MNAPHDEPFTLDLARARRCGFPEVVYGEGKDGATLVQIVARLLAARADVLVTRLTAEKAAVLLEAYPAGRYNALARMFSLEAVRGEHDPPPPATVGRVGVVTAGTSDLPIAEEVAETLRWMRVETIRIHDVGVAGPHRLPERVALLRNADAVVVVAGMEGALPSVVGGYVDCPVIGVPTSVGYGANLAGISALLSMLNSCAANVTVVNIDAGFKGGYVAGMIARRQRAGGGASESQPARGAS